MFYYKFIFYYEIYDLLSLSIHLGNRQENILAKGPPNLIDQFQVNLSNLGLEVRAVLRLNSRIKPLTPQQPMIRLMCHMTKKKKPPEQNHYLRFSPVAIPGLR